jgi:hypothetical protein
MRLLDVAVTLACLVGTVAFGRRSRGRSGTFKDYFGSGRTVPWCAIMAST